MSGTWCPRAKHGYAPLLADQRQLAQPRGLASQEINPRGPNGGIKNSHKNDTGGKNHQRAPRPGRARRRGPDLRALHGQGAARDEGRDERRHLRRERRLRPETGKSQGARRDAAADDDCYWWTLFRAGGAEIGVGKRVDGVGVELGVEGHRARERYKSTEPS